jgi:aldehyde dehydrogenase (NAD+)
MKLNYFVKRFCFRSFHQSVGMKIRNTHVSLETRMFINNEFTNGIDNQTLSIINPATEEKICDINIATEKDIDLAVNSALHSTKSWEEMPVDERANLFFSLANKLEQNIREYSLIESLDNGKSILDSEEDVKETIRLIRYYGGWTDKILGSTYANSGDVTIHSRKVPYGIVGLISPWNYPLLMAAWKLFPALAAGNSCVLKCSEETPLTILKLCHLIKEVGFPKGVVNVLPGFGHIVGERLCRHEKVHKVSFTGSSIVGGKVVKASGESNLKKVHLELGGKSPIVICEDANIDEAVKWSIDAAFRNSSQNCSAGTRLFVQEKIYQDFLIKLTEETKKIKVGSFMGDDNFMGPLINRKQFEKVLNYIRIGRDQEMLNLLTGGKRMYDRGFFVEPTIFSHVPDNSTLAIEEIFGPVLVVMTPFKNINEALLRSNDTKYGLGAGVFTNDMSKAEFFVRGFEAGSVWVNFYNFTPFNVPFGGMKLSGFGRDCAYEGLSEFLTTKSVYYKNNLTGIK